MDRRSFLQLFATMPAGLGLMGKATVDGLDVDEYDAGSSSPAPGMGSYRMATVRWSKDGSIKLERSLGFKYVCVPRPSVARLYFDARAAHGYTVAVGDKENLPRVFLYVAEQNDRYVEIGTINVKTGANKPIDFHLLFIETVAATIAGPKGV